MSEITSTLYIWGICKMYLIMSMQTLEIQDLWPLSIFVKGASAHAPEHKSEGQAIVLHLLRTKQPRGEFQSTE